MVSLSNKGEISVQGWSVYQTNVRYQSKDGQFIKQMWDISPRMVSLSNKCEITVQGWSVYQTKVRYQSKDGQFIKQRWDNSPRISEIGLDNSALEIVDFNHHISTWTGKLVIQSSYITWRLKLVFNNFRTKTTKMSLSRYIYYY